MTKDDFIVLGAARAYTKATVVGLGALKGASCQIKFTEAVPGGTKVTFSWEGNDGTEQTTSIYIMDGQDGKGIRSISVNSSGHLIITYDDGTTQDAGKIEVQAAVDSVNGKTGEVELVLSDVVTVGDGLSYNSQTNTLAVSEQSVENTIESVLDDEMPSRIEDGISDNMAEQSDIDNLFN